MLAQWAHRIGRPALARPVSCRTPAALEPAVSRSVPLQVELSTSGEPATPLPVVHAEVRALGQTLVLRPASSDTPDLWQAELPDAPRHLRLRLWCEGPTGPSLCGDLVHTPASTARVSLALVLEADPTGHWQLLQRDPGVALPLWAQVLPGLVLGLAVLVHWHRRER